MDNENPLFVENAKLDLFDHVIVPAHKLDADQYLADDLDGVTEGLFGSGSMAYATLQASQTDAVMATGDGLLFEGGAENFITAMPGDFISGRSGFAPDIYDFGADLPDPEGFRDAFQSGDKGLDYLSQDISENDNNGNFSNSTLGSASASELSNNTGSFGAENSNLSLREGFTGTNGSNGLDGQTPPPATNGTNGTDGADATGGNTNIVINLGDTIIDLGDTLIDLGDLTQILNDTFINLGDTITTLTTSVTNITEVLGDVINNLDITNILDLTEITNTVENITINLTETVNNTLVQITNITTNITNLIENILGGNSGDLALNLDLNVLNTALFDLHVPFSNLLNTDANLTVDLNPAVTLVNNVADLTGLDALSDSLAQLGGTVEALQNTIDQVTDLVTDLDLNDPGATVEQLVEIIENLDDTVSEITGSVDDAVGGLLDTVGIGEGDGTLGNTIDATLGDVGDLLGGLTDGATDDLTAGLEDIVDPVTDLVDDLTDDTLDELGETATVVVDDVTDTLDDLASGIEDVLTGEGDLGDVVEDVLENTTDIVDEILDGAGDATEELVSDLGDTLDDLSGGATGDLTDALEDITGGLDDGLDNIGDTITDLAENLTDDLGDVLSGEGTLGDVIDEVAGSVTDTLDDLTGGATGDLTDALDGAVDQVTDLVDDLTGPLLGGGEGENPLGDLTGALEDILNPSSPGDPADDGLISQTLDPVVGDIADALGGLSGGTSGDLGDGLTNAVDNITDLADTLTGGLLGGIMGRSNNNNNGADTDLAVDLGLGGENSTFDETLEAAIDPVEDLVGDIDIGLDTTLLGDGEINNNEGDSDLTIQTGIDLVDNTILNEGLDAPLDPLEAIIGDVDIDLNVAADLLGEQADGLIDQINGGTGEDTLLANLGDGLGDIVGGVLGGDASNIESGAAQTIEAVTGADELITDALGSGAEDTLAQLNDLAEALGLNDSDPAEEGLISQTLDPVIGDASDVVDDLLSDATGGASDELTANINTAVDGVTDLADALTGGLTGGLLGETNDNNDGTDGDLIADLDLGLLNTTLINAPIEAALDPVEDLAGDIDLGLGGVVDLLNPQGTDNANGDSDITAQTDLELINTDLLGGDGAVHLDPIEQLTGDIDLDVTAVTDLLSNAADPILNSGAGGTGEDTLLSNLGDGIGDAVDTLVPGLNAGDGAEEDLSIDTNIDIVDEALADADLGSVLDPVENIAGDIDSALDLNTDLLGNNETDNAAGDNDITADIDIDLLGQDLIDLPLDIPLDPVESLIGDIDLDISGAIDLLNTDTAENGSGSNFLDDVTSWTESTITDGGGLFGDLTSGLGGTTDVLPDPVGTIAEGIGAIHVEPVINLGKVKGLFG